MAASEAMADLRLADFAPRARLVVAQHEVRRARFPTLDVHNHLGRWTTRGERWMVEDVPALLATLESANIPAIVNLDGRGQVPSLVMR